MEALPKLGKHSLIRTWMKMVARQKHILSRLHMSTTIYTTTYVYQGYTVHATLHEAEQKGRVMQ